MKHLLSILFLLLAFSVTMAQVPPGSSITMQGTGSAGGGGTYAASNGLTMLTNNTKLGGPLTENTLVTGAALYQMEFRSGLTAAGATGATLLVTNTASGNGLYATSVDGVGVSGVSSSNYGVSGQSTTSSGVYGYGIHGLYGFGTSQAGVFATGSPNVTAIVAESFNAGGFISTSEYTSTTGDELVMLLRRATSGTSANGIGITLQFSNELLNGTQAQSSEISSRWDDNVTATRTGSLHLKTVLNGTTETKLSISGAGQLTFQKYGVNTFSGTPAYGLGVLANGTVVEYAVSAGGGGDVTGPASSTDRGIPVYSGTGGKTLTTSLVGITAAGVIDLPAITTPTVAAGDVWFDNSTQSLSVKNSEADVTMNLGQENWTRVYNNSGATITNGQAVYINGGDATSGLPTVALARADAIATTIVAGLATHDIENNTSGYITAFGPVRGLNTSTYTAGAIYLSAATAGALTQTQPSSPNFKFRIGNVVTVNASTGVIHAQVGLGETGDATTTTAQTFTNKRIARRVTETTSTATLTFDKSTTDQYNVTALAANITIAAPIGSPNPGDMMMIRLKDNGTARTITWNAAFRAVGVTLPTTTVISKVMYAGAIWNVTESLWDVVSIVQQL